MSFSVEQVFVGRTAKAPLKTPAWEARISLVEVYERVGKFKCLFRR